MSKTLPERLRDAARKLRTSNIPLSDFIPLLQQAADYIEAQGVPDVDSLTDAIAEGLRGTYHCTRAWEAWHVGTMDQDDFEPVDESDTPRELSETVIAMLAAAPPAPQPEQEPSESVNETNAVLAGRYFDLLKVVEAYEKNGVTCQTFRHFVDAPCAECNCTTPPQPQPVQEHVVWNKGIRDSVDSLLAQAGYRPDSSARHQLAMMNFDTPQAQPAQPLSDGQINQMWSDAHNDTSPMSLIHVLARAIEAAHGIKE